MPARKKDDALTYPELTAFKHHEVDGKTIPETAAILNVDEKTIDRMKKKSAWRDLTIAAIKDRGHTLDDYAAKLIEMKDKKKQINVDGKLESIEDNTAQIAYLKEIASIYGLYAPQKHEIAPSLSDEELDSDLEEAARKLKVESVESGERESAPEDSGEGERAIIPV